jgi:hypothetical protein
MGDEKKRFGHRAGGNFLTPSELRKDGTMEVEITAVNVIPANEDLDIEESDGLTVRLPSGQERDFRLNVRNSRAVLDAVPEAEDDEGASLVGRRLLLAYLPDAGRGKAGIAVSKVLERT